ncbi:hypothetical protein MMC07_003049 [Pseudocyphellaria aurata]|nr:hypothetical protein [Pseudocyphellaria aurata]
MSATNLFYYSSKYPLQLKSFSPSAPKTRQYCHYEAIEAVAKGSQPFLSLCLETSSDSTNGNKLSSMPLLESVSTVQSSGDSVSLNSPTTRPVSFKEQPSVVAPNIKTSSLNTEPENLRKPTEHEPPKMEDALPNGTGNPIISWTDDDYDTIDYKNTPDYDPDQDNTEYGTSSESEPESELSVTGKTLVLREAVDFRQYIQLKTTSSGGEVQSSGLAPYLLVLDIGSPLAPPDPEVNPELTGVDLSSLDLFMHHFSRYPYLTADENYIRKTAYVQISSNSTVPPRYLIVQEFSKLGSRGEDGRARRNYGMNWELKRVEAKAWWRKSDRGGKGVRVGFYESVSGKS